MALFSGTRRTKEMVLISGGVRSRRKVQSCPEPGNDGKSAEARMKGVEKRGEGRGAREKGSGERQESVRAIWD